MTLPQEKPDSEMAAGLDRRLAHCIRALAVDAVEQANSGHPGMPLGMADAALVLFSRYLKYAPSDPLWPDRDRFILSNGHGSMLQYALLYLTGYEDVTIDQIRNFRQLGSNTPGHPEYGLTPGIEVTTGPLGQGLAAGVGMAMAERRLAGEFGCELVDHRTWVFAGDGCLMEGVGQEAVALAGHQELEKLIVVFDDNRITIDGDVALARSEDMIGRMRACGWRAIEVDGHDLAAIDEAFASACNSDGRPVFVALRTVIGYGSPTKAGKAASHGAPLGAEEAVKTKEALGWQHEPFAIPDELLAKWRGFAEPGEQQRLAWLQRLENSSHQDEFKRRMERAFPPGLEEAAAQKCAQLAANPENMATRKASRIALDFFGQHLPELMGGSADLTDSNMTRLATMQAQDAANPTGSYVYYGVREFAMSAAVNGMFLHSGLIPYAGTFLIFSDYARNAIRLAALMQIGSIFVMTHDSIGLGEDGPTHQPIEQLASLRAIPHLQVMRPADVVETFECWQIALNSKHCPSLLALTRQGVPQLRDEASVNRSAHGAYVIREPDKKRDITILATGSEVHLAVAACERLAEEGIAAAAVSMPCWELFDGQSQEYRQQTLGTAPRIAVEAASSFGWNRYVASESDVVGIDSFGKSAPAADVYRHCNVTTDRVVELAKGKAKSPRRTSRILKA